MTVSPEMVLILGNTLRKRSVARERAHVRYEVVSVCGVELYQFGSLEEAEECDIEAGFDTLPHFGSKVVQHGKGFILSIAAHGRVRSFTTQAQNDPYHNEPSQGRHPVNVEIARIKDKIKELKLTCFTKG